MKVLYERVHKSLETSKYRGSFYKFLTAPWIANNSFYQIIYSKRIRSVMSRWKEFPKEISIETTNFCNARCVMCAYPIMQRKKGFMEEKLFRKIVDELKGKEIETLLLSGFGEPLLDKRLPKFIEYAKNRKIPTIGIVTNGSLLTKAKTKELINAGLDELNISIDGVTKETFNKIRVGLDLDVVKENIMNLKVLSNRPRIIIKMVIIRENEKEAEKLIKEFKNIADQIFLRQAQDWVGSVGVNSERFSPHLTQIKVCYPPCHYLWTTMSIYWDGRVPLCCLDYDAKASIGNVKYQDIEMIWKGEKLESIRKAHIKGKRKNLVLCKNCKYFSVWW